MLPPLNTSRPFVRPLVTPPPTARLGERARVCGTPISFIQLHKRCSERLPNKLDGRLLQYPYNISLFPLALNTWAFNSFIITINGPRPIYFNTTFSSLPLNRSNQRDLQRASLAKLCFFLGIWWSCAKGTTRSRGYQVVGLQDIGACESHGFFTVGKRAVYRGNRCYRWGTVMVPSGSNWYEFSNLNLN
jgi:hypothetical protein